MRIIPAFADPGMNGFSWFWREPMGQDAAPQQGRKALVDARSKAKGTTSAGLAERPQPGAPDHWPEAPKFLLERVQEEE